MPISVDPLKHNEMEKHKCMRKLWNFQVEFKPIPGPCYYCREGGSSAEDRERTRNSTLKIPRHRDVRQKTIPSNTP